MINGYMPTNLGHKKIGTSEQTGWRMKNFEEYAKSDNYRVLTDFPHLTEWDTRKADWTACESQWREREKELLEAIKILLAATNDHNCVFDCRVCEATGKLDTFNLDTIATKGVENE